MCHKSHQKNKKKEKKKKKRNSNIHSLVYKYYIVKLVIYFTCSMPPLFLPSAIDHLYNKHEE